MYVKLKKWIKKSSIPIKMTQQIIKHSTHLLNIIYSQLHLVKPKLVNTYQQNLDKYTI